MAGIASPQTVPFELETYLNLTQTQVQSIDTLNIALGNFTNTQLQQFNDLQSQATAELAKTSPDPGVVGNLYGQMAMINRKYNTQLAQTQTNIAAVLTPAQIALVNALLQVAKLQSIVAEAQQVDMEPAIPTALERSGDFSAVSVSGNDATASLYAGSFSGTCCYPPSIPTALSLYLDLSDAQSAAIQNAIVANQIYVNEQSLKIN
jgi:hypothetical protein